MTIQPDVARRPQVLMALERIIAHIKGHHGVRWVTFDESAEDLLRRSPRPA
jgi:peptidoglycan-N-acetylglucosamine deacetylase